MMSSYLQRRDIRMETFAYWQIFAIGRQQGGWRRRENNVTRERGILFIHVGCG